MINTISGLLMQMMRNLYASEMLMLQELPAIIEKAKHTPLKNAINHHLSLTEQQIQRLEKIASLINERNVDVPIKSNENYVSKGALGLIEETKEMIETGLEEDVVDAAIIAGILKMEHYEIISYTTALAFAKQLKLSKVEALLNETLDEEYEADNLLTALANATFNKEAISREIAVPKEESTDKEKSDDEQTGDSSLVHIDERTINSPGGRAGTSHRGYGTGESRGH